MSCYHPLLYVPSTAVNSDTGKRRGTVISFIPLEARVPDQEYIEIPCGKCIGCRLDYSRQWADRMALEAKQYADDELWFFTLTYDNEHLPMVVKNGNAAATLCKRDVQLFMKSLRKHFSEQKIRFFCSGEYGPKTNRPHYHMVLFGLRLDDLTFYKVGDSGFNYYNSKIIETLWKRGHVVISPANWQTMNYTARYVVKKLKGFERIVYEQAGIVPPFSLQSRKPGIAGDAFSREMFKHSCIILPNGRKASFPRYFKKLLEREDPDIFEEMRLFNLKRAEANEHAASLFRNTDKMTALRSAELAKEAASSFLMSKQKI